MKGIIHRDLKPENIFIMHNPGPHLRIKVVDFGLAKVVSGPESGEQITRGGVVCGTPEYMSPEQAKGEKLDGRSDVYALGCVMFAMLEGDAPFRGKKALDVAMMHINNPFPQMSNKIPEQLRGIIMKCVEKKASARYQNVNELAGALESFLDPIECRKREATDVWSVRRSTPPNAGNARAAAIAEAVAERQPTNLSIRNDTQRNSESNIVRRTRSSHSALRASSHKPLNSQCIRLKTTPTLTAHSKTLKADVSNKPAKKESFFKRCLDRIL